MSAFSDKVIFVWADGSDTHFRIANREAVDRYWEDNPDADNFAVAWAVGRDLTSVEKAALPDIIGAIAY